MTKLYQEWNLKQRRNGSPAPAANGQPMTKERYIDHNLHAVPPAIRGWVRRTGKRAKTHSCPHCSRFRYLSPNELRSWYAELGHSLDAIQAANGGMMPPANRPDVRALLDDRHAIRELLRLAPLEQPTAS